MMKRTVYFLCLGLLLLVSCMKKQDFNQLDGFSITPTITSSLVYVESPESVINASPINFYENNFIFEAFSDSFFSKRVIEGSITYEIENTTSKELSITLQFLDVEGLILDQEEFTMQSEPTAILFRQIFYGAGGKDLNILTSTSEIRVLAENLGDNSTVSSIANSKFIFKSSGEFTLRIK